MEKKTIQLCRREGQRTLLAKEGGPIKQRFPGAAHFDPTVGGGERIFSPKWVYRRTKKNPEKKKGSSLKGQIKKRG